MRPWQACGADERERAAEPLHLALGEAEKLASLRAGQTTFPDSPHQLQTIDLARTHRGQLGHRVASRVSVTFGGDISTWADHDICTWLLQPVSTPSRSVLLSAK